MYYFACTVGIGFLIYQGMKYNIRLVEEANKTYEVLPVLIFATIYPIVIGIILRMPKLLMEIKDKKEWTFNWIKVIAIGMPALYIAFLQFFHLLLLEWIFYLQKS